MILLYLFAKDMLKFIFVSLFIFPISTFAQDLYGSKSDSAQNQLNAYFYKEGEPTTGANLLLSYEIPIDNLNLNSKARLEKLAKANYPDIFDPSEIEANSEEMYRLAKSAKVEFKLFRSKNLYGICAAPKNFYGYGISAVRHTQDQLGPYVTITSNILYVNKKPYAGQSRPFNICKNSTGQKFNPVILRGDQIKLVQNGKIILTGKFRTLPK